MLEYGERGGGGGGVGVEFLRRILASRSRGGTAHCGLLLSSFSEDNFSFSFFSDPHEVAIDVWRRQKAEMRDEEQRGAVARKKQKEALTHLRPSAASSLSELLLLLLASPEERRSRRERKRCC